MPRSSGLPQGPASLALAVAGVALVAGAAMAGAAGKVPNAEEIKKVVAKLYDGDIPFKSSTDREKAFIEIDNLMKKDKGGVAMKTPEFWVEAIQTGRFKGKKQPAEVKKTKSEDIEITTRDDKTTKAKLWYHAGALVNASKPCPVLLTVLEKGADAKAYLDATWEANKDVAADWVVGAIAISDEFPLTKESRIVGIPFIQLRDLYNTDANRWYLEGVGNACNEVQTAACQVMAHRIAGLVLRGATKAVTNSNTALYPTLLVHCKQTGDKPGPDALAFEEYKKIDATNNEELIVDDLPSITAPNDGVVAWFAKHPQREMPTSYKWTTTLTDQGDGEAWAGTLNIQAPTKRNQPTTVSIKYLRDTNTVDIQCENLGECLLYMNDTLLNLDKPVTVVVNGKANASNTNKLMERSLRDMFVLADSESEWGRVFTASTRVVVPTAIAPPAPDAGQPPGNPPVNPPAGNPPDKPPANPNPPPDKK